jgi:ATP/maltotriose-dependent transcriptional regulator MalT
LVGDALAALREGGDAASVGKGLATYSNAARMTGRYDLALELAAEALQLFKTVDDRYLCAYALLTSGCAAFSRGSFAAAHEFFARSLDGYRSVDAAADIALALGNLGVVAFYENDLDTATLLSTESAQRARELGNAYYEASASATLARIALARGDTGTARATHQTTLRLARAIGDKELLIGCIEFAARLLVEEDPLCGATFLGCVDAAREFYHVPRSPIEREEYTSLEVALVNRLRGDMYAAAKQTGRALGLDDVLEGAAGEHVGAPRPRVALAN